MLYFGVRFHRSGASFIESTQNPRSFIDQTDSRANIAGSPRSQLNCRLYRNSFAITLFKTPKTLPNCGRNQAILPKGGCKPIKHPQTTPVPNPHPPLGPSEAFVSGTFSRQLGVFESPQATDPRAPSSSNVSCRWTQLQLGERARDIDPRCQRKPCPRSDSHTAHRATRRLHGRSNMPARAAADKACRQQHSVNTDNLFALHLNPKLGIPPSRPDLALMPMDFLGRNGLFKRVTHVRWNRTMARSK